MLEELKNTPDIDPSGLFSTYKTHPSENEGMTEGEMNQSNTNIHPTIIEEKQKKEEGRENANALRIIVDGFVRIAKIALWSVAVFGGLFIAALATNTIDRAVYILNTNLGTSITISGEVSLKEDDELQDVETSQTVQWITSTAISDPTSNTPEMIASKRRAILEARKAAKLLEEKQKALEQLP